MVNHCVNPICQPAFKLLDSGDSGHYPLQFETA